MLARQPVIAFGPQQELPAPHRHHDPSIGNLRVRQVALSRARMLAQSESYCAEICLSSAIVASLLGGRTTRTVEMRRLLSESLE